MAIVNYVVSISGQDELLTTQAAALQKEPGRIDDNKVLSISIKLNSNNHSTKSNSDNVTKLND